MGVWRLVVLVRAILASLEVLAEGHLLLEALDLHLRVLNDFSSSEVALFWGTLIVVVCWTKSSFHLFVLFVTRILNYRGQVIAIPLIVLSECHLAVLLLHRLCGIRVIAPIPQNKPIGLFWVRLHINDRQRFLLLQRCGILIGLIERLLLKWLRIVILLVVWRITLTLLSHFDFIALIAPVLVRQLKVILVRES